MTLSLIAGGTIMVSGAVVSIIMEQRMNAQLDSMHPDDPTATVYGRAATHALLGIALGLAAFVALPPGPLCLCIALALLSVNVLVLWRRRHRCSSGPLRRAALWACLGSRGLFVGTGVFLLGGGKAALGL